MPIIEILVVMLPRAVRYQTRQRELARKQRRQVGRYIRYLDRVRDTLFREMEKGGASFSPWLAAQLEKLFSNMEVINL